MSTSILTYNDYLNLARCATGAAANRADSAEELQTILVGGGIFMAAPMAFKAGKGLIWDAPKYFCHNGYKNIWNDTFGKTNLNSQVRAGLKGNFLNTVNQNYFTYRYNTLLNSNSSEVKELAEDAKNLTGKRQAAKIRQAEKAATKAKIATNNAKAAGTIKSSTRLGRAASYVKTKTGARALENKVLQGTLSKNAVVRNASKLVKGGGGMAVISAAIETPEVYKTYKELGAAKGTKQLVKSAVNVAAETAGYVVGAKVGAIAGAKIGATVGTCIGGPIGTAIGGAIGTVVGVASGLLGSWLFGKASRAIVGKNEREIHKEKQAQELAKAAKNDTKIQTELITKATEKLQNGEVASEKIANDTIKSYNKVVNNLNGECATETNNKVQTVSFKQQCTTEKTNDNGLFALSVLAGKVSQPVNNPFTGTTMFNPTLAFNPFAQNYLTPFMYNPFMYNTGYAA